MSDSRSIRHGVSAAELADVAEVCVLSGDEEAVWGQAVDVMDCDFDGVITGVEFDDFRLSMAGENLFGELYSAPLATELRHRLFAEAEKLFYQTPAADLVLLTRQLEILEQAQAAALAAEERFHSGGLTERLLAKDGTAWTQYGHAKENLASALDQARLALEEGCYDELPRKLKIAKARLQGVKDLWQSYLNSLDESAGAAAESSKGVVKAAVATEIVLGAGLMALPGAATVSTTTTVGASLSVSVFGHAAAATLVPPLLVGAQHAQPPQENGIQTVKTRDDEEENSDRLHTSEELVQQAQAALTHLQNTGTLNLDFGRFIIEAHLAEDHAANAPFFDAIWQEFQNRRGDNFELAEKLWSFLPEAAFTKKIDAIRRRLYADGSFTGYWAGQAQMNKGLNLDVLMNQTDAGGNCTFRNLTLVSYMTETDFPRHDDWTPGVQKLPAHIQPVLYNAESNEVWDLSSGQIKTGVDGTIYQPGVMLWSYAATKTNSNAEPPAFLIIAEPSQESLEDLASDKKTPQDLAPSLPSTNSLFRKIPGRFVPGAEPFTPDDAPKFAFVSYRDSDRPESEKENSQDSPDTISANGSQQGQMGTEEILLIKPQIMTRTQADMSLKKRPLNSEKNCTRFRFGCFEYDSLSAMTRLFNNQFSPYYFDTTYPQTLVFANPHHALIYESHENDRQRLDYLKFLADNRLREEMQSELGKKFLGVFLDPKTITAFTKDDWQELFSFRFRLEEVHKKTNYEYQAVREHMVQISKQRNDQVNLAALGDWRDFPDRAYDMPALMNLVDAMAGFSATIASHPKDALTFLNSLPPELQYEWLSHTNRWVPDAGINQNPWTPLMNLVADPTQVGFSEKNQTPPAAAGWPKLELKKFLPDDSQPIKLVAEANIVGLENLGTGHFAVQTPEGKTIQKKSENQAPPSPVLAKTIIDPKTMFEILRFDANTNGDGNRTLVRFTPDFSAEFQKLNASGLHDKWFADRFHHIIDHRLNLGANNVFLGLDPANPTRSLIVSQTSFSSGYGVAERSTRPIPNDLAILLTALRDRNPQAFSQMFPKDAVNPTTLPSPDIIGTQMSKPLYPSGPEKGGGEFY